MASDFRIQFHNCIVNKKYIGFDKQNDLIEQKKRVTPLAVALPVASVFLQQMEDRSVTDVRTILDDLTLLEKRYKARINSCGWKFKKFICMLLAALKILKVNPYTKHEGETLKAMQDFRARLLEMCHEPVADLVPEPLPPPPLPPEVAKPLLPPADVAKPLPPPADVANPLPPPADVAKPLPPPAEVKPVEAETHANVEGLLKALEEDLKAHVTEVRLQQHLVAFQRGKGEQAELQKGGLARECLLGLQQQNPKFPMEIDNKLYWLDIQKHTMTAFMPGATIKQFHAVPPELVVINRPVAQKIRLERADIANNCLQKLVRALQKEKLPTELEGFKKITLRELGPDFFALLPWISSKEAIEIDCSGVVLTEEQFKQLLRSFPVIQKLDLRGFFHLDLTMLKELPYLQHLTLDAVDKSDLLTTRLAIDALQPCTVHTEFGEELVEAHYNEKSGFYPRYLPIQLDLFEAAKEFLRVEDLPFFLNLIEKRKEVVILTIDAAETFSFLFKKEYIKAAAATPLMAKCIQKAQAYLEEVKGKLRTQLKELGARVVGVLSVKLGEIRQDKPLEAILSDDPAVNKKVDATLIPQLLMLRFNLQGVDKHFCEAFDDIVEAAYAELMAAM